MVQASYNSQYSPVQYCSQGSLDSGELSSELGYSPQYSPVQPYPAQYYYPPHTPAPHLILPPTQPPLVSCPQVRSNVVH